MYSFFFFQAEDGIRDLTVTGVQTCALPISTQTRRMTTNNSPWGPRTQRPTPSEIFFMDRTAISPPMDTILTRLGLRRSEEHTSELQSQSNLVCRLLLEKKKLWRQPQHDVPVLDA